MTLYELFNSMQILQLEASLFNVRYSLRSDISNWWYLTPDYLTHHLAPASDLSDALQNIFTGRESSKYRARDIAEYFETLNPNTDHILTPPGFERIDSVLGYVRDGVRYNGQLYSNECFQIDTCHTCFIEIDPERRSYIKLDYNYSCINWGDNVRSKFTVQHWNAFIRVTETDIRGLREINSTHFAVPLFYDGNVGVLANPKTPSWWVTSPHTYYLF